jgi:autotransporter-associated beta strand protein
VTSSSTPSRLILTRSIAALFVLSPAAVMAAAWQGTISANVNDPANWDVNPSGQNIYFGILGNQGGPAPFRATLSADLAFPVVDIQVARGGGPAILNHTAGTAATGNNNWLDVGTDGGTGTYNLANTAGTGGTLTGFAQGSGSIATGGPEGRIYVGGVEFGGGGGTGTFNINTTGTVSAFRLIVGEQGTGVVNFDSGTINLANDLTVGFRTNGANSGNGTFNMSGGTVNRTGGWTTFGRDGSSQGHFNQSGGTMNASGTTIVGLNGSTGTFTMTGGIYNAGGEVWIGNQGNGNGTATVSAGTFNVGSWLAVGRDNSNGTLTISGTGEVNQGIADGGTNFEMTNFNGPGTATVNLNGGSLSANRIVHSGNADATSTFNFNGGVLKPRVNEANFLGGLDQANVRNGGAKIDTNGFNIGIGQVLAHSAIGGDTAIDGGLTKLGAGILTLSAANTYTGATNIDAGTLVLTGSISASNLITVDSGATFDVSGVGGGFSLGATQTLAGDGTVVGGVSTSVGTKLSPGQSPGTLTLSGALNITNAISLTDSDALVFELGVSSDQILLTAGALTIGSGALAFDDFVFSNSGGLAVGTYTLFNTTTPIIGTLDVANLTGAIGGFTGTIGFGDGGNDIVVTVVPEPGTAMVLLGGMGLLGLRRRRK